MKSVGASRILGECWQEVGESGAGSGHQGKGTDMKGKCGDKRRNFQVLLLPSASEGSGGQGHR